MLSLQRDPDIWGPDADEFRPERWLDGGGPALHSYAYIPFSKGPRDCIGQTFAQLEAKAVLSLLMRRFSFRWVWVGGGGGGGGWGGMQSMLVG
jgi:cytochrome P450